MTDRIYTSDYVEARFREMGSVVATMPDREFRWLLRGQRATWPEPKQNPVEAYGYHDTRPALTWPTTHQHDRSDECLEWLLWLRDDVDRTIVLAVACRARKTAIARKLGMKRPAVSMRHRRAIGKIVRRLNEGVDACDANRHGKTSS